MLGLPSTALLTSFQPPDAFTTVSGRTTFWPSDAVAVSPRSTESDSEEKSFDLRCIWICVLQIYILLPYHGNLVSSIKITIFRRTKSHSMQPKFRILIEMQMLTW